VHFNTVALAYRLLADEGWLELKRRRGAIVGTVPYMSPEQARGAAVDARSDIWSLGCLLYEMLAGRSPFAGPTTSDVLVGILDREPPPLTAPPHHIPAECDWIITKTLRKNADERYQKIEELLTDVRRLQEKLALESHQRALPPPPRPARPSSRISAAVLAALLMAGAIGAVWYWRPRPASSSTTTARSLAVLPLKSLDAGDNYLGLGIADAVIRRTSQTGGMVVRPTSAVRRYMTEDTDALTAARQLSTDVVLEGSVQRAGERLRVSVNLLRAVDGASLWADSFDLRMTDIFEIQDRVAREVASHLQLRIDPAQQARLRRRPTTNPVAYEYSLRGLHLLDQRMSFSVAEKAGAIDFLNRAIAADPDFAPAHAQLALAYAVGSVFRQPGAPETDERAMAAIARAQALDPGLPEIALARSRLLFSRFGGFRGDEAVRVLLEAQRIDPNVGHSEQVYNYTHLGLSELAERAGERALEIDPTSDYAKRQVIGLYEMSAQWDRRDAAQLRFFPNEPMSTWALLTVGRLDDARRALAQEFVANARGFAPQRAKAVLDALEGDVRTAKAAIPDLLASHPVKDPYYHHTAYMIACIYAAEPNSAEAVKWLREAAATGFQVYPLFQRDALLDKIRQAPEFVQFMTELNATVDGYRREFDRR
jgi:serine/threonine-protein kinase